MTRGILLGIAYNNRVNEIEIKYSQRNVDLGNV